MKHLNSRILHQARFLVEANHKEFRSPKRQSKAPKMHVNQNRIQKTGLMLTISSISRILELQGQVSPPLHLRKLSKLNPSRQSSGQVLPRSPNVHRRGSKITTPSGAISHLPIQVLDNTTPPTLSKPQRQVEQSLFNRGFPPQAMHQQLLHPECKVRHQKPVSHIQQTPQAPDFHQSCQIPRR